ncbi:hypothetical protein HYQ44_017786 [Verticillium longisporum]|nr:hypothetical protein HYQ44_017786 [Verticillium longisporum]
MISVVSNSELKDETPKVTVRRLKKRESNRNAQHAARERTKSRIAHLEELVAHLSNNNTNAEVPYLMKCLLQTSHERDKLFGVLASLSTMIRHHTDGLTASQEDESPRAVVAAMQVIRDRSQQNELFRSNLTLVWQSGFDGCFMQNAATGRFELAPLFEERIRDIKAWTMNADILNQYPELADDIPLFTGLPATPSTPQNAFGQQQARWTTMPRPIKGDADEPAELVPQQQQQRKQAEDELAKGSALIVTTQAPAFADEEVRFQCPNVYMTMAGQPTHTYGQSGFIEPIPLAPTVPGPGGQHVYVGGLCFDMYC